MFREPLIKNELGSIFGNFQPLTRSFANSSYLAHTVIAEVIAIKTKLAQSTEYGLVLTEEIRPQIRISSQANASFLYQAEIKTIKKGLAYKEESFIGYQYKGYVNQNGEWEGVGIQEFKNRDKYYCEYYEGKMQGICLQLLSDGSKLIGEFYNDKVQGFATYQSSNYNYTGQYDQGLKKGYGIAVDNTGQIYNGEWENDQRSGWAWTIKANGEEYLGQWKNDQESGEQVKRFTEQDPNQNQDSANKLVLSIFVILVFQVLNFF